MSAEELVARDAAIVAARANRVPWSKIAEEHAITARVARQVYREYMAVAGQLPAADPVRVVDDLLRGFVTDLWEFTEATDQAWEDGNMNAVISATRSRMDVREKITELLQASGRLPRNLGQLQVIHDVRFLVEQVVEVFDSYAIPIEAKRELMARIGPVLVPDDESAADEAA